MMSSSPESPSRFIWEPGYKHPVANMSAPGLLETRQFPGHGSQPHNGGQYAYQDRLPAFGAPWQPAAPCSRDLDRRRRDPLQPRIVELADDVDPFAAARAATSRFNSLNWGVNPDGPPSPFLRLPQVSNTATLFPHGHRYRDAPSSDVSPRQSTRLPSLRPLSRASEAPTEIYVCNNDYPRGTNRHGAQHALTIEVIQDICHTATTQYLELHEANWRARDRRGRQFPVRVVHRRRGRDRRFNPYPSSRRISDLDERAARRDDPFRSNRCGTNRLGRLQRIRQELEQAHLRRRNRDHESRFPGEGHPREWVHRAHRDSSYSEDGSDGDDDDYDEVHPRPTDTIMANATAICSLLWKCATTQRLYTLCSEVDAVDNMGKVLRWAGVVAFAREPGPEGQHRHRATIVEAARDLCEFLGYGEGVDALGLEDEEIGGGVKEEDHDEEEGNTPREA